MARMIYVDMTGLQHECPGVRAMPNTLVKGRLQSSAFTLEASGSLKEIDTRGNDCGFVTPISDDELDHEWRRV